MVRLGVVSFLNARPLVEGLGTDRNPSRSDPRLGKACAGETPSPDDDQVQIVYDVPALLPGRLLRGEVDAALVPIVDVFRYADRLRILCDACIGCDGETLTVRIFSHVPPEQITTLWTDGDSHTSVALACVLWERMYGRRLVLRPMPLEPGRWPRSSPQVEPAAGRGPAAASDAQHPDGAPGVPLSAGDEGRGWRPDESRPLGTGLWQPEPDEVQAMLLIGDKVVDPRRGRFACEIDLGGAWREHTGLPFVFAVWAVRQDGSRDSAARPGVQDGEREARRLADLLTRARDRGVARAGAIAREQGPRLGWPAALAEHYLTRCIRYRLDARMVEGAELFARLCQESGILPPFPPVQWPQHVAAVRAGGPPLTAME